MNQGLTDQEIKLVMEFFTKANDEQMKYLRGVAEGRWKERQLRASNITSPPPPRFPGIKEVPK